MNIADTHSYAKWLLGIRGDQAEAFAAKEQRKFEAAGEKNDADNWRRIRMAISQMRGAHVS